MFKRIVLFLALNCIVVLTISLILSLFNITPYLTNYGLNLQFLMIFCLLWGMIGAFISLALSRKMAKWLMRVELVDSKGSHAKLYHMVQRLAQDAGLPETPEVGVFPSSTMNAFATGPTQRRSLVAVSTGLLNQMDENELKAVLGHEISHIENGDMVTMTLIQGVVNAFVMFLARVVAYAITSAKGRGERGSYGSYYITTFILEILFMILGSMLVAFFARHREFRADRGGALLTKKEYMIVALEKLKMAKDPQKYPSSMNAMMISMPNKWGILKLFATHPPIQQRINRLKEI